MCTSISVTWGRNVILFCSTKLCKVLFRSPFFLQREIVYFREAARESKFETEIFVFRGVSLEQEPSLLSLSHNVMAEISLGRYPDENENHILLFLIGGRWKSTFSLAWV